MHTLFSQLFGFAIGQSWTLALLLVSDVLALVTIASVLLQRSGRPTAALSWILAVMSVPFVGVVAWWLMGRTHLSRHRRRRIEAASQLSASSGRGFEHAELPARLGAILPFAVRGSRLSEGVFPPARVTSARVLSDGDEAFPAMEAAIRVAKKDLRAIFYIWEVDETGRRFAELLLERARAGVTVRLVVDAVGSADFLRKIAPGLRAEGISVVGFLPARFRPWTPTFNFRNHRKLLIIDGETAFVGGMNIADEYAHTWHDMACMLRGPVVSNLEDVFQEDWYATTGEEIAGHWTGTEEDVPATETCTVIASGPDRQENRVHDAFFLSITQSQERLWLSTPYFVPSAAITAALRSAAQRGVDVRLIVPQRNDLRIIHWASRSYYAELVRAGVRVFEYTERFTHQKTLLVDSILTMIGSPNADVRSFRLNFELACFVYSEALNERVATILENDVRVSEEVTPEDLAALPVTRRLVESAAHLLSPLL